MQPAAASLILQQHPLYCAYIGMWLLLSIIRTLHQCEQALNETQDHPVDHFLTLFQSKKSETEKFGALLYSKVRLHWDACIQNCS